MEINENTNMPPEPLRILTWHVHGSYLYYLAQGHYKIYLPVKSGSQQGYGGRGDTFPFGENVIEVPAADVCDMEFDCILYQSRENYLLDQYSILSESQRKLPRIYLEHDPPREVPTDTRHVVYDPGMLIVHVTHFNALMWNNNRTAYRVIEHGVLRPQHTYSGELERGVVVINNLAGRGRCLGWDIFQQVRKRIPLDLIGMGSEQCGLGEIPHGELPGFISRYRFFFNPIRYTSLGLAILESMMIGQPIVGLATTELVTVIKNGENGYVHTNVDYLCDQMEKLLSDSVLATALGEAGQQLAMHRFSIERFVRDWEQTFRDVVNLGAGTRGREILPDIQGNLI